MGDCGVEIAELAFGLRGRDLDEVVVFESSTTSASTTPPRSGFFLAQQGLPMGGQVRSKAAIEEKSRC